MESPFVPALEEMQRTGDKIFKPQKFQKYLKQHFDADQLLTWKRTARFLSIQSFGDLDAALRDAGIMVLRLGRGTFGLVKVPNLKDFFLFDSDFQPNLESFIPTASEVDLFPFKLLGSHIESNAVNLAIASGLMHEVLHLDAISPKIGPTTGAGTYSFSVRPHQAFPDLEWSHERGQVEVDALLFAYRQGRPTLFVIEAKKGNPEGSLPKHKLVYPVLSVSSHPALQKLEESIEIVPIYMRSWEEKGEIFYRIAECNSQDSRTTHSYISDLTVAQTRLLSMPVPSTPSTFNLKNPSK